MRATAPITALAVAPFVVSLLVAASPAAAKTARRGGHAHMSAARVSHAGLAAPGAVQPGSAASSAFGTAASSWSFGAAAMPQTGLTSNSAAPRPAASTVASRARRVVLH